MLQFFRKHQHKFVGAFMVALACVLMLVFGIDFSYVQHQSSQRSAIRVDDVSVDMNAFNQRLHLIEMPMRRQLGENYDRIRPYYNPEQQAADSIIDGTLFNRLFASYGLTVSPQMIRDEVFKSPYFANGVTKSSLNSYLRALGMNSKQLEREVSRELLIQQIQDLFLHASFPIETTLKKRFRRDEEKRSFSYLEFDADDYRSLVDVTKEDPLVAYYEAHKENYRVPKAVKFSYVRFGAEKHQDSIKVDDDDLQLRYSQETEGLYVPESFHLRRIFIKKPQKTGVESLISGGAASTDSQMSEAGPSKLAADALDRVRAGDDFVKVVGELSDDVATKDKGGDIGWVDVKSLSPQAVEALRVTNIGEVSNVVEDEQGFSIYKVEEHSPQHKKELVEVKDMLLAKIKSEEAPIYAAAQAQDFLYKWRSFGGSKSIVEYATSLGQEASEGKDLVTEGERSGNGPYELTSSAINVPEKSQDIVSVGGDTYLVDVSEVRPSYIPEFSEARARVLDEFVMDESLSLAKTKVQENLEKAERLEDLLVKGKEVKRTESTIRASTTDPIFASEVIKEDLFSLPNSQNAGDRLYRKAIVSGRKVFAASLLEQEEPAMTGFEEKKDELSKKFREEASNRLMRSLAADLRSKSDIYVSPDLFTNRDDQLQNG